MSSTPSHAGGAYEPLVSSPLNPRSCEGEALALRRRRNSNSSSNSSSKMGRRITTTASMSPAQRLLRHKAAQAWRLQASRREALRLRQAAPLRPERYSYENDGDVSPVSNSDNAQEERGTFEEKRHGAQEEEPRPPHYDYLFRMPEAGFFTPQRMVLAMGVKRMLPLVSPHDVLRSAKARREREERIRQAGLRMA